MEFLSVRNSNLVFIIYVNKEIINSGLFDSAYFSLPTSDSMDLHYLRIKNKKLFQSHTSRTRTRTLKEVRF